MPLHFILSQKKKPLLMHRGFLHNKHRLNKNSIVWKCVNYKELKCPGEVHTSSDREDGTIVKEIEHKHLPDIVNCEVRTVVNSIREKSINTNEKSSKVIAGSLGTISDQGSAHMPSASALSKMVQRIRAKKVDSFPTYDNIENLIIPEEYTKTFKGKMFLLHDSLDGDKRFLLFSTQKNLKFLKQCSLWFSDGTFKVVPVIFHQLYTIHGYWEGKTIPLVYMLLPKKSKKIYKAALSVLKSHIGDFSPEQINVDFEIAFIKTFMKLFPDTRMKGCFYHFKQCVNRHMQILGYQNIYATDLLFINCIKMISSLTFVPSVDVIYAYDLLLSTEYFSNNDELLNKFLTYFEHTWIGEKKRQGRGQPLFPIELWNNYTDVLNDTPRTNNPAEGWHNRFANIVEKCNSKVPELINSIKTEQNMSELLISQAITGKDISHPQRKKQKTYDDRLKRVVLTYAKDDVLEYLENIAALIVL